MSQPKVPRSVTRLVRSLESGDAAQQNQAAEKLWDRYGPALEQRAKGQLAPAVRRREDEKDVAQAAYADFCVGQRAGKYQVDDRNELWNLLTKIAENKAKAAAVRHRRGKRDYRREHQESADADRPTALDMVGSPDPTPSRVMMRIESEAAVEQMLAPLDEPLRQVARWRLLGYNNKQIAADDKLGCSERTVERKLNRIREILSAPAG